MSGNLIRCQNGHLFSSRRYGTVCPYCNIETATKEKKSVEKSQEEIEDILFLEAENQVLRHSHGRDLHEMLVYHAESGRDRVAG